MKASSPPAMTMGCSGAQRPGKWQPVAPLKPPYIFRMWIPALTPPLTVGMFVFRRGSWQCIFTMMRSIGLLSLEPLFLEPSSKSLFSAPHAFPCAYTGHDTAFSPLTIRRPLLLDNSHSPHRHSSCRSCNPTAPVCASIPQATTTTTQVQVHEWI